MNRRDMLKVSTVAAASSLGFPIAKGGNEKSANERINIAMIGIGGIHRIGFERIQ